MQSSNSEMSFTPSEICIKTNGAVTWINNDTTFHTISSGNFVNGSAIQLNRPSILNINYVICSIIHSLNFVIANTSDCLIKAGSFIFH